MATNMVPMNQMAADVNPVDPHGVVSIDDNDNSEFDGHNGCSEKSHKERLMVILTGYLMLKRETIEVYVMLCERVRVRVV